MCLRTSEAVSYDSGPAGGLTNDAPYLGVPAGCLGDPSAPKVYTTADLDAFTGTGACPGGLYSGGTLPDVSKFTSPIVDDLTQSDRLFWNNFADGFD